MNRREFIKTVGAFLAALGLGVKAKAQGVVTSVGRGSPRMIDSWGIIVTVDEWTEEMERDCIVDVRGFIEDEFENSMRGNSGTRKPIGFLSAEEIAQAVKL